MTETETKCAFCNRAATTWHHPRPINGRVIPSIPICGGKCNNKRVKKTNHEKP
jgi:hypothetical protein